jgi:hypothetical protein
MGILIGNESMLQAKRTLKIARIQGNDAPRHTPDFVTPLWRIAGSVRSQFSGNRDESCVQPWILGNDGGSRCPLAVDVGDVFGSGSLFEGLLAVRTMDGRRGNRRTTV